MSDRSEWNGFVFVVLVLEKKNYNLGIPVDLILVVSLKKMPRDLLMTAAVFPEDYQW